MSEQAISSWLPLELWQKVVEENFTFGVDLISLWTSTRNISHTWRKIVDDFVVKNASAFSIPHTNVNFFDRVGFVSAPLFEWKCQWMGYFHNH